MQTINKNLIEKNIDKELYLYLNNFITDGSGDCYFNITDDINHAEKYHPHCYKLKIEKIKEIPEYCKYKITKHIMIDEKNVINEWIQNGKNESVKDFLGIVEIQQL